MTLTLDHRRQQELFVLVDAAVVRHDRRGHSVRGNLIPLC